MPRVRTVVGGAEFTNPFVSVIGSHVRSAALRALLTWSLALFPSLWLLEQCLDFAQFAERIIHERVLLQGDLAVPRAYMFSAHPGAAWPLPAMAGGLVGVAALVAAVGARRWQPTALLVLAVCAHACAILGFVLSWRAFAFVNDRSSESLAIALHPNLAAIVWSAASIGVIDVIVAGVLLRRGRAAVAAVTVCGATIGLLLAWRAYTRAAWLSLDVVTGAFAGWALALAVVTCVSGALLGVLVRLRHGPAAVARRSHRVESHSPRRGLAEMRMLAVVALTALSLVRGAPLAFAVTSPVRPSTRADLPDELHAVVTPWADRLDALPAHSVWISVDAPSTPTLGFNGAPLGNTNDLHLLAEKLIDTREMSQAEGRPMPPAALLVSADTRVAELLDVVNASVQVGFIVHFALCRSVSFVRPVIGRFHVIECGSLPMSAGDLERAMPGERYGAWVARWATFANPPQRSAPRQPRRHRRRR